MSTLHDAIAIRLALLGHPGPDDGAEGGLTGLLAPLLARQEELSRRVADALCPADRRVSDYLQRLLGADAPDLPTRTLVLDRPGLARELSLPRAGDTFRSALLSSHRLRNGVLHNPASDRRTTAGVFHLVEGGLAIPDDKKAVPVGVFGRLLDLALQPPADALALPYTSADAEQVHCFVSLLLRPLVLPEVPGQSPEQRMEIRFIAPGGLVSNLDFVESIFGNGGDPSLPEHDAALDPAGWTGHTGCVVLAPHLTQVRKVDLGLPHVDRASERQRRDGMCWEHEDERYNDGQAFKICSRDTSGVIVTVIADNYFGYCKKEVKTQIGFSANLLGRAEEEHSGGALVLPGHDLGHLYADTHSIEGGFRFDEVLALGGDRFERRAEGHATDRLLPRVMLVPEGTCFDLDSRSVSWEGGSLPLRADRDYVTPNGSVVRLRQTRDDRTAWGLVLTRGDATVCHKPSTVSGGGKSEISKALSDAILSGKTYVADIDADLDTVAGILARDYSRRWADPALHGSDLRPVLSTERSVGSVIKLLTPSSDFSEDYNSWLRRMPPYIKELVFTVKRFYRPEWGEDWATHFSVGIIDGRKSNTLRVDGETVRTRMLRVGFEADGSWRQFALRPDFHPSAKVQTEDDITASTVVPADHLGPAGGRPDGRSGKIVANCERLLFQRPDEAVHRGYDTQAEADIAQPGTFLSNFEPLDQNDAIALRDNAIDFSAFTTPMRGLIEAAADADDDGPAWFVSSAHPRIVDGRPSKNPRYLQRRPDLADPTRTATADLAVRLHRRVPLTGPMPTVVDLVAAGRRNNPPEDGVPPLCAFNPLHYLDLPELFMEFISSMTGKSPSTTGAGSEGALTKGPFNAMPAPYDLNAALLSYALTGYDGWVSCAGWIGPRVRVDHDISLVVPEVFSRMTPQERDARALLDHGFLEPVPDLEHEGRIVRGSRLGYRMTSRFAAMYFGRIFMHPDQVFTPEMLRPEEQDRGVFVNAIDTIVLTHERVARSYLKDGTVELACPPIRALLEVMADGSSREGWTLQSPELRSQFTRESVLSSDWYAERLDAAQRRDQAHTAQGAERLEAFCALPANAAATARLGLDERARALRERVAYVASPDYRSGLVGTLGRETRLDPHPATQPDP